MDSTGAEREKPMGRVIHFEIHAAEPARAQAFYESVFGWRFQALPGGMPYWLIHTGEGAGIDGGMMQRMGPAPAEGQPVNAFVCTIGVADVDASAAAALKAGGTMALPKMAIQGVGWQAYVKDTEGNIIGLHAADPAAA